MANASLLLGDAPDVLVGEAADLMLGVAAPDPTDSVRRTVISFWSFATSSDGPV